MKNICAFPILLLAFGSASAQDAKEPLQEWIGDPSHGIFQGMIHLSGKTHADYHRGYRCPSYEAATFVVSIVEKAHLHEKKPKALRAALLRSLAGQGCKPAAAGQYLPLQLGNVSQIDNGPEAGEEWTALRVQAPDATEIGLVYDASVYAIDD
ncbi:hypothetical protein MSC49_37620 (plasmid) [Methylosinus sp. C49]|nr:hypothetical protein MSC49_37620 [Methylosinus sp. C49]